jgi:transcriptional regulator with XRE-family HTH domain
MTVSLKTIGQWIVDQRKSRGMTQLRLSDAVGISPRTLSKIENGFDMKMSLFLAIAEVIGDDDAAELLALPSARTTLTDENVQEIERHLQAIKQILHK